jgi:putative spermidine/putrescine transport system ATP-binding protein
MSEQMVSGYLQLRRLRHNYGTKTALDNVSLTAEQSEIVALLGPSGSGKSTLLNVIAGIVKPDAGSVFLNGRSLLDVAPEFRGLGMVFQDYALWPHMTVAENVAFPLRARHFAGSEISLRVKETLARVGLGNLENRRPHQLSGGQQQRVALARAVIADTDLLLLDEPLSALDPATRGSVRSELAEILRRLKLTSVIVTHDREEAFELADTVCVLIDGRLQQQATPRDVYERPANLSVARFMGANVLPVQFGDDGQAEIKGTNGRLDIVPKRRHDRGHVAFVPEQTRLVHPGRSERNLLRGKVIRIQYRGGDYSVRVKLDDPVGSIEARSKDAPRTDWVFVYVPPDSIHFIPENSAGAARPAAEDTPATCEIEILAEEIA